MATSELIGGVCAWNDLYKYTYANILPAQTSVPLKLPLTHIRNFGKPYGKWNQYKGMSVVAYL